MTYEEARQSIFSYCVEECGMVESCDFMADGNCVEALAIKALDRQIKKKPLGTLDYLCPTCKSDNIEIWYDSNFKKLNYCPDCGQAIDWRKDGERKDEVSE